MATLTDPSADPSGLGDIVQLQDGEQQNAVAAAGKYRYFMVTIPAGFDQLFIAITTLTGDPDVYVRFDPDHPTRLPVADQADSYGWRSSGEGDDTITIAQPTGGVYVIGWIQHSTLHTAVAHPSHAAMCSSVRGIYLVLFVCCCCSCRVCVL